MSKNRNSTNPPYSEQWSDDPEALSYSYSELPSQPISRNPEASPPAQPNGNSSVNSSPFYNLKRPKKAKITSHQSLQLPFQDRFNNPPYQPSSSSEPPRYVPVQHYLEELENHLYEMEDRLTRRIYWLQRRLVETESKVDTQRKFLFVLILAIIGFFYFTFIRVPKPENSPEITPTPQNVQPQPS